MCTICLATELGTTNDTTQIRGIGVGSGVTTRIHRESCDRSNPPGPALEATCQWNPSRCDPNLCNGIVACFPAEAQDSRAVVEVNTTSLSRFRCRSEATRR